MKHIELFNNFMKNTVNLNDVRIKGLDEHRSDQECRTRVGVGAALARLDAARLLGSQDYHQASRSGEFDADLIVFVQPVNGWDAATYIDTLYEAFRANNTYQGMVKRWSHCVTITYANDKKIDVAPVVVNRDGLERLEVCNHYANQFERTEPKRYTEWLVQRNGNSGNNSFRKVTRLIKYLRDIKSRFTCSSVLLTTILGYRIDPADQGSASFPDTPTALKTVFSRMDDWLQANLEKRLSNLWSGNSGRA